MEKEKGEGGGGARHYYQGGYDYDFVAELDRDRFECPICLLCQRDPHQTSCGHRFCYSCILTWLKEGKTCPKDNCTLGEGDLFQDSMAHREILQLLVRCPTRRSLRSDCPMQVRLADAEHHAEQCQYAAKASSSSSSPAAAVAAAAAAATGSRRGRDRNPSSQAESSACETCGEDVGGTAHGGGGRRMICPNARVACPYTSAGCEEKVARKDLDHHERTQVQKHLKLLCEKMLKLQQTQGSVLAPPVAAAAAATATASRNGELSACREVEEEDISGYQSGSESLPNDGSALVRAESIRLSGSNMQSTQKLLRELFHRLVQVEQRSCQLQISNEQLSARLTELSAHLEERRQEDLGRWCRGHFLWRIPDFNEQHRRMRQSRNLMLYSPPFYTSPFGYRVCLRCNVSFVENEEHLGLFVHLMRGDHDDALRWPFSGRIDVTIVNLSQDRIYRTDCREVIDTRCSPRPANNALSRPTRAERNPYGYGFKDFARVNSLHTAGFVHPETGALAIRACVREVGEEEAGGAAPATAEEECPGLHVGD